jgi:hypothetical protein
MMRIRADDVSSDIRRELDSGMVLLATDYLQGNESGGFLPKNSAQHSRRLMFLPPLPYRSRHRASASRK